MQETIAAIFLDRDGTLIMDENYIREPEKVRLLETVPEALKLLRAQGYALITVSNQSGVGRGIIQDFEFEAVHNRFEELLLQQDLQMDQYLYCFHTPTDNCNCRKPRPGLLPKELNGQEIRYKDSFTIGDSECDLLLADAVGSQGILVLTGKGRDTKTGLNSESQARYPSFETLLEAAKFICR